jgi:hypothetical protein
MPVPQALVSRYFQLIASRQFTEAERELDRLKQRMTKTEWNRGYFRALYGVLLSRRNNDNYSFLTKLDFTDKAALHGYRREFLEHTRNGLHGDFDRGFFSAWADFMRVLARIETPNSPSPNQEDDAETENAESAQIETLKSDKSQATIANFLKKKNGQVEVNPETKE